MRLKAILLSTVLVLAGMLIVACGNDAPPEAPPEAQMMEAKPIGATVSIEAPLGLPTVPIPEDNPPTAETIALGRKLYYDTALSVDGQLSCASCHGAETGFADPRPVSVGFGGKTGARNAPTVMNAAYYTTQFWDGRAASLEEQALGPMQNPVEMAHSLDAIAKDLSADTEYVKTFETAFGPGPITDKKMSMAIASFERTVVVGNSPFDRFLYGGEKDALSESAKRGLEVFRDPKKANCAVCHTIDERSALFTDSKFHNLGVGADIDGKLADPGRYEVTKKEEDRGAFKTPTLRNISMTAPYMHDGSLKTLKEVLDFYIGAGNSNPFRDKDVKELDHLTGQERQDVIAFLEALTGPLPPNVGPPASADTPAETSE